jgi:hypothetical protein
LPSLHLLKSWSLRQTRSGSYPYAYEQFLFGRSYAKGLGERAPAIPIGLLYNLAAKLPLQPPVASDPSGAWNAALALARDFVAALDLEPYTHFAFLGIDGPRLESGLRQVAHYDHCFSFRQWHLSFTPEFLTHFFGDAFDADLKEKFGWTLADAVQLARCLNKFAVAKPTVIPIDELVLAGMDRNIVMAMLPQFAHHECEANRNYRSPFDATGPDIIFKPLILFKKQFLVIPIASTVGPALFEAAFAASKTVSSSQAISDLRGGGTERLTKHVFSKRELRPTFETAKYDLGTVGAGECDFVFEDDQNVVFVECKAKALTRAAMTGAQGEALLDFAGGLFASQAQALRHERILRSAGSIQFVDGTRLDFRDRNILRLTVTLVDHGAVQDRWFFRNLYNALLSVQVSCPAGYAREKQVRDFNENLKLFQEETRRLEACGQDINTHPFRVASASVAQLDILLEGALSLTDVRTRLSFPTTFSTLNVLAEHFQMERARQPAESG